MKVQNEEKSQNDGIIWVKKIFHYHNNYDNNISKNIEGGITNNLNLGSV